MANVKTKDVLISLREWYKNDFNSYPCKDFWKHWNKPTCTNKPFVLVVSKDRLFKGCHPGYLWRFRRNWQYRDELLKKISVKKIWTKKLNGIQDFEELYKQVWETLNNPKIPQIGQLVIYDIALHLAYIEHMEGTKRLMPENHVYLHALPENAFGDMKKKGLLPPNLKIIKGTIPFIQFNTIPYNEISQCFPNLSAAEIEDLFCQIGKSIRRIKKGKVSKNQEEQEIDRILLPYFKI